MNNEIIKTMNRIKEITEEASQIAIRMAERTAKKEDFKRLAELDKELSELNNELEREGLIK